MTIRNFLMTALSIAAAFAAGCDGSGPKLYKVRGTVQVDGKPASDALVFLHRQGRSNLNEPVPYGRANANGEFVVTSVVEGDGALAGDYVITVAWPDMSKAPNGNGERPDLLRGTYDKAATSTIKATVEPKDNQLPEIALRMPTGPAPKEKEPAGPRTDK